MNKYNYADKDDKLTVEFIENSFNNDYWVNSEINALNHIFNYVGNSCKMLDLGCGKGRLFDYFLKHVKTIHGVEPDKDRFNESLNEAKRIDHNRIKVVNGNVKSVMGQKFDLIFISHVFQHIPVNTVNEIIDSLDELLNEDGFVATTTTYTENDDSLYKVLEENDIDVNISEEELNNNMPDDFYVREYSTKTIEEMFNRISFEIIEKYAFHFTKDNNNDLSVEKDIENNINNNLSNAVDILYILKRKK